MTINETKAMNLEVSKVGTVQELEGERGMDDMI